MTKQIARTNELEVPIPDRLLVFIPAYNCARQIGRVLAQFDTVPTGTFAEILVLDNRSKDDTLQAAMQAASQVYGLKVTVAQNHANYGLGGSHKAAFSYAAAGGFTHVIVLHGDDQGRIQDALPVLARGLHRRFDCCLGSRFASGSTLVGYRWTRRMGNYVFNALFSLVSRRWITDLGAGLNVIGREIFFDQAVLRYSDDLRFNCYLLLGLVAAGRSFRFFPIRWTEEDQISNVKIVSQSLNTLKILVQYLFRARQFRLGEHRNSVRAAYTFDIVKAEEATAVPQPTYILAETSR